MFYNLKKIRESHELTQREMAKILKISKTSYNYFETGEHIIPLKHLNNFCNLFHVSMDYVCGLTNINIKTPKNSKLNPKVIGNKIKQIRLKNKLTQEDLAILLNTSQSNISSYENGKTLNIGKSIEYFKIGTEYASGGAGGISTVDDYMKFLEGLRTHKLLKAETLKLMTTDRLNEQQKRTYPIKKTHGYGLGVRCPIGDNSNLDFGWGGLAGAYLAIDTENEISIYFGSHIQSSPMQAIRSLLYRFIRSEIINTKEFDDLYKEIKETHNYNLTY